MQEVWTNYGGEDYCIAKFISPFDADEYCGRKKRENLIAHEIHEAPLGQYWIRHYEKTNKD